MKRTLALALAAPVLALVTPPAASPAAGQELSLEEVLTKHYEAIGGLERWKALRSIRATGTMDVGMGMEIPFRMVAKRPRKVRFEFDVQGMTGVQAYDGETAWMFMPFMGRTEPEAMPEAQARYFTADADIDGPLVGWKEDGHTLELVGQEEVEGATTYKIKVTMKNGDVRYYYLDAEYFLPIKVEGTTEVGGTEVKVEQSLGDYKEVDGLLMAHSIQVSSPMSPTGSQTLTIQSVELDVELDDAQFSMPGKEGGTGGT